MSMKITEKGIKKFSAAEKQKILEEAQAYGVKITLEKYGVYPATYYYWKKRYAQKGPAGLTHQQHRDQIAQMKRLEQENVTLKLMLAEEQMESRLKDELLKKKYPELRKYL